MSKSFKQILESFGMESSNTYDLYGDDKAIEFGKWIIENQIKESEYIDTNNNIHYIYADELCSIEELLECFEQYWKYKNFINPYE